MTARVISPLALQDPVQLTVVFIWSFGDMKFDFLQK